MRTIKPEYYENQLSLEDYEQLVRKVGMKDIVILGNRPFPAVYLPAFLEKVYVRLMKFLEPLWNQFDNSLSKLSRYWGAGWWVYGVKPER